MACFALALVTGVLVAGMVQRAARAESRFGRPRPVLVATAALAPGERLDASHTEIRSLPAELVPATALASLPTGGRTVTSAIAQGEPVLAQRISGAGRAGPAALMPPESRAVAVPTPVAGLPLKLGDHVDLLATGSGPDGRSGVVARYGVVIATGHDSTTVAVGTSEAPAVAEALGGGNVVIALRSR